jgi:pyridinium-3,5-biscarboxylic acid mononucleotide synthase
MTDVDDLGFAAVDIDRERRQGLPEVVYGPGKTPSQIASIVRSLLSHCTGPVMVSRISREGAAEVTSGVRDGHYDQEARMITWRPADRFQFQIAIVTAGTADGPTAAEATRTALSLGMGVTQYRDVGVAGLHRLLSRTDEISQADAVIVIAGMEGALASVVGGLIAAPLIAVPTSTGYGAALEGVTALLAMLTSCAAGITVVNIDNGLGAALAAYRLARSMARREQP